MLLPEERLRHAPGLAVAGGAAAGAALEADAYLDGEASAAGDALKSWWTARFDQIRADLAAQ